MSIENNQVKLSVVTPCYNEEQNLEELTKRLINTIEPLFGQDFEIILVDDGSTDDSWKIIEKISNETSNRVRGIKLSRNFGHENALTAGLKQARGDYVFILDADLQDPPELLESFYTKLRGGYDVVYGKRLSRKNETAFKVLSAKLFYKLINRLSDTNIPKDTGDFRLVTRRVIEIYLKMPENFRFVRGMIAWMGFKQTSLEYHRDPRHAGETKYTLGKMVLFALNAITGFSVLPLRFSGYLGVGCGIMSFFLGLYILISFFVLGTVRGWTSLAALITFFGSIQLITISIIGEYLGRIYMEGKHRPLYLIEETTDP